MNDTIQIDSFTITKSQLDGIISDWFCDNYDQESAYKIETFDIDSGLITFKINNEIEEIEDD